MKVETKVEVLETELKGLKENNTKEHQEIKAGIKEVVKEVKNLGNNYIVFKTRVLTYWGIGIVILSALINRLIDNL